MRASQVTYPARCYSFSWFIVIYTVLVIAWGAWVRLSGSGDGCGDDWPRCNGAVIPLNASLQTAIEYSHRLSTAVYGLLVLFQIALARKVFPKGYRCRAWSWMVLLFTITEALIGRSLVKEGLVDQSTDTLRLIVMPLHLINTSLLLFTCVMTAESFKHGERQRVAVSSRDARLLGFLVVILLLILTTGAIAALGSHLAPSSSLLSGLEKDLSSDSHLAVRLRWIHPLLALLTTGATVSILSLGSLSSLLIPRVWTKRLAATFFATVVIGVLTLGLLSPMWLKVTHLVMANVLVIVTSLALYHTAYPENPPRPR